MFSAAGLCEIGSQNMVAAAAVDHRIYARHDSGGAVGTAGAGSVCTVGYLLSSARDNISLS